MEFVLKDYNNIRYEGLENGILLIVYNIKNPKEALSIVFIPNK